jgi:hypothetical protein
VLLLFQASLLACYWAEGVHTATYLLNLIRTKAISSPHPTLTSLAYLVDVVSLYLP